jgi:hypothetical protein
MAAPAPPTTAPRATAAPTPTPPQAAPQAAAGLPGNTAFGLLADGSFIARLGAGLRLSADELKRPEGVDLTALPQPLPGVRLTRAKLSTKRNRLEVDASLAVPQLEAADVSIHVDKDGKPSFAVRALRKRLELPALGNPQVALSLSEEGVFGGSVTIGPAELTPRGLRSLTVTGGGTLTITGGRFSGAVDATLTYARLGSGEVHFAVSEAGRITGTGALRVTPPFLNEANADLALGEDGNLSGSVTVSMTEAVSPIPALSLAGGTLTVRYANGAVSGSLTEFRAAYRGLADVSASAEITNGAFSGQGNLALTVPGLKEASGKVQLRNGAVSGSLTLASSAFPQALPVKSGRITATLAEDGSVAFAGNVGVELGPVGKGQLTASYSQTGELAIAATINLTIPGLQGAQVSVAYVNGDLSGEAQVPIDPSLIPGLNGNATVRYQQGLWSGETEIAYSADNGKLSGRIRVTVAQAETGALQLGGAGEVEAQIAPRLRGKLTATILPEGGVDVSGRITVTEPLELFPEARFDKELFKYSQNIPLWAILVAVIRVRAGIRGGVGAGVFRNIVVEGSYTIGNEASDPTFSISGEMFIPAFIEAYVAFGAGLGLDVVLGSLTGGIEGVATAGIYGAISVVPELSYSDGDWSIEGDATLAAGARLKVGLNAWAEIEALWVTVWEETWQLGEWVWNVGPDLALQAHMAYRFGQPGPPELDFKSSDIDTESMIKEAMPKDGPAPSGAKEALQNKAEWKGKLKEQKPAPVPPDLAAQSQAPPPAPPEPAQQPKPKGTAPPAGGPDAPGAAPAQPAAAAATPDTSAKGAVPESQVPTAGTPRYPHPVSLATIDEPPAPMPRTKEQEGEDVAAAERAVELVIDQAEDTDALDDWFPRIKNRFRLVSLGFAGDFDSGIRIEGGINPQIEVTGRPVRLKGSGIPGDRSSKHVTKIKHSTGTVGGTTVGLEMIADPLGPDHPLGSEATGQDALMNQLPTDSAVFPATTDRFVRGHLLNYDLGGLGRDFNLYPITSQANAEHSNFIERSVKGWVNDDKFWVRYKVKVLSSGRLVPLKGGLNAVESVLEAEASILNTKLAAVETKEVRIVSRFDAKKFKAGATSGLDETDTASSVVQDVDAAAVAKRKPRDIDEPVVPRVLDANTLEFDADMYDDLATAHDALRRPKTMKRLMDSYGFGPVFLDVLYKAYDEVRRRSDKTIHSLDKNERSTFRRIANKWNDIRKQIV